MNNAQTAEILKKLCKSKNITITELLTKCAIRKSLIYDMEKRDKTPSAEVLEQIADFLECSVDYLLGRTDVVEVNRKSTLHLLEDTDAEEALPYIAAYDGGDISAHRISVQTILETDREN